MSEAKEFYANISGKMEKMQADAPAIPGGFSGMFGKLMKEGSLSVLEKEFIALGIAVCQRCAPCIRMHVKKALMQGRLKSRFSRRQVLLW